jgi:hypothetical protein
MVQARFIQVRLIGRRRRCNLITAQAVTGATAAMVDMAVTAVTAVTVDMAATVDMEVKVVKADKAVADRNQ